MDVAESVNAEIESKNTELESSTFISPYEAEVKANPFGFTAEDLKDVPSKLDEISNRYKLKSLDEKVKAVSQAFGHDDGRIKVEPYTVGRNANRKRIIIDFGNGEDLSVAENVPAKDALNIAVRESMINALVSVYNPESIDLCKKSAYAELKKLETADRLTSASEDVKPYTFLGVEFNTQTNTLQSGKYYAVLAVEGKVCNHITTDLELAIRQGKADDIVKSTKVPLFKGTAGGIKEEDMDYIFAGSGFSSNSELYAIDMTYDAEARAEKALASAVHARTTDDPSLEWKPGDLEVVNDVRDFLVNDDCTAVDVELRAYFDVDKKFMTNTASHDDEWVNLYAAYNPYKDELNMSYSIEDASIYGSYDYEYIPTDNEKKLVTGLINEEMKSLGYTVKSFIEGAKEERESHPVFSGRESADSPVPHHTGGIAGYQEEYGKKSSPGKDKGYDR